MMAKMFYTLDETKSTLGKNEEEIKQLSREGRLREFRDGQRLMFKADQVDALKAEIGGDMVSLGPSDTGGPMGFADSRGGASGSGIGLVDSQASRPGAQSKKEETAFADIGLSGTIGGVPSPSKQGTGAPAGGTKSGTKSGITVFDVDDAHRVDPSAQTSVGSGIPDQVSLEGIGSGSGLLDLTRESDDTSLGAVFDELQPTSGQRRGGGAPPPLAGGSSVGMSAIEPQTMPGRGAMAGMPIVVEAPDALAPAFAGVALAGALILAFGGFILTAAVMGAKPQLVRDVYDSGVMWIAIGAVVAIVLGVVGLIVGKMGSK